MTKMEMNTLQPVVAGPGVDRAPSPIAFAGLNLELKVTGADTDGNFAIGLLRAEPLAGPPLHMHTREDEWFYVLSGELTFQVDQEIFTAGPGTSVFAPRNVPHTWRNLSDQPVEAVSMVTPAAFVGFLQETGGIPEGDDGARIELAKRYGNIILGPPIQRQ